MRKDFLALPTVLGLLLTVSACAGRAIPPTLTGERAQDVEIISNWLHAQKPVLEPVLELEGEALPPPIVITVGGDAAC